jgi:hypothetical protein
VDRIVNQVVAPSFTSGDLEKRTVEQLENRTSCSIHKCTRASVGGGAKYQSTMSTRRANIYRSKDWFKVLQTTSKSQTAVMALGPGKASGGEPGAHEASDQVTFSVYSPSEYPPDQTG